VPEGDNRVSKTPDRKTYAAFIAAMLIGGANFVAVSFSNRELPPFFGATARFATATVLFFLLAAAWRIPLARGRAAVGAAIYGLLGVGISYALLYYALVGLSAGTVAVIVATVPLFTLAIAVSIKQERLSLNRVAGGVLALAGIVVLSLGGFGGDFGLPYFVAAVFGAAAIAASSVVAKAYPEVHPLNMNAIGTAAGTLLLVIASLLAGEEWTLPRSGTTWIAVGWLAIAGSVGLFQLWLFVIGRWTASATVYALTGMPVIAAGLASVMLDQSITLEVLIGGALVIAAVYVGVIARRPESPGEA
jgi:drug/metabolite transporter (DMT)-like permease